MERARIIVSVALGTIMSLLAAASVLADGGGTAYPR
jgi:hypothetical protein